MLIGPADGEGEESFDFVVCTPEWLGKQYAREDFVFGRHHLIVFGYEFSLIASAIEGIVAQATGATWAELAAQLARYGQWEFEDFRG